MKALFAWLYGLVSFNLADLATSPECQLNFTWQDKWTMAAFAPVVMLLLLVCVHAVREGRQGQDPTRGDDAGVDHVSLSCGQVDGGVGLL